MKITSKAIIQDKINELDQTILDSIKTNNTLLQDTFNNISFLSSVLSPSVNSLTVLSDQVTDALVITGSTKLGINLSEVPVISSTGINFQRESNTLLLKKIDETVYQVNTKRSQLISNSNSYSIYNMNTGDLGSFEDIFKNDSKISIRTKDRTYKYTFSLSFSDTVLINTVDITLGLDTESYPLVSEIYYVDENNRKINCFIHNTKTNSIDLDTNRVKDNKYSIQIEPIQTGRIYVVLEDYDKVDLVLQNMQVKKTKYEASGSITFGPIVSSLPILKASLAASQSEGVRYFISHNNEQYVELTRTGGIDLKGNATKVVRYNTVNENSVVSDKDIKTLYVKVELETLALDTENTNLTKIGRSSFNTYYHYISNPSLLNTSVYSDSEQLSYGLVKTYKSYKVFKALHPNVVKLIENNTVKIKGFIESDISFSSTSDKELNSCIVHSLPLKKGANTISCRELEPYSLTLYGFVLSRNKTSDFNTMDTSIVIPLKSEHPKGIYTIRQDDKEIAIDLSLGYVSSCSDVVVVVKEGNVVTLLDELGRKVKTLSPYLIGSNTVVSLINEGMFELPASNAKNLNINYPFILNTENSYSIDNYSIVNTERLIELSNVYTLTEEKIDTKITVSRENENTIKPTDNRLLERYTKQNEYNLEAFTLSKAIKLADKNIKKGTFKVAKYSDPYLTEVNYKNGIEEFKLLAYTEETKEIRTDETYLQEVEITLEHNLEDLESVQASIKGRYEVALGIKFVSEEEKSKVIIYTSELIFDKDVIEITYLHVNEEPTNYYSVDYENGVFYLSNFSNLEVKIEYQYFNTYLRGTKAIQLDAEEYTVNMGNIDIKEKEEIETYTAIYDYTSLLEIPNTTPLIQDIKINYLNSKDEESLL